MKQCYICTQTNKEVDWKNAEVLRHFLSSEYKILAPRVTGTCAKHQRQVARAIKRARVMAIVPFTATMEK
ncbi:MAG: 30S ribosomal protein S18 [Candidatus Spechtbacterales bacterium]